MLFFSMITVSVFLTICIGLSFAQDASIDVDGTATQRLHSRLFQSNIDVAYDTYSSPFVQGMITNELDPNKFGSYMIQDIVYLKRTRDNLQYLLNNRAVREGKSDPNTAFGKYASDLIDVYDWFYGDLSTAWQLSGVDDVAPSTALKQYVDHQLTAFDDESIPIECTQIILLPCENL
jgi:thiaminase